MSAGDAGSCRSCRGDFNKDQRRAKMLRCYHTFCSLCLEAVFQDNRIVCLDCSSVTRVRRVSDLPDNPYATHGGDDTEVFYSDHEEESEAEDQSEVERLRRMIQEENMKKVSELLYLSSQKVLLFSRIRKEESSKLVDVLKVTESFKSQIAETLNDHLSHIGNLEVLEAGIYDLKRKFEGIDLSDSSAVSRIYEKAVDLSRVLNTEVVSSRSQDLKQYLGKSSVKVEFDVPHDFLSFLKAEKDKLTLALDTDTREKPTLFLLRYLLSHIFQDKIASFNSTFKELLGMESSTERNVCSGPLESAHKAVGQFNSEPKMRGSSEISSQRSQPTSTFKKIPERSLCYEPLESSSQRSQPTPPATPEHPCFSGAAKIVPIPKRVFKKTVGESNRPHCFFMVQVGKEPPFRVVFELRPDMAPRMVENFVKLCRGLKDGRGYEGSRLYNAKADTYVGGGDYENNDGSVSRSAFKDREFMADRTPLKNEAGAIRMRGVDGVKGECKVGSLFRIWTGDVTTNYKLSLVFGKVVEGLDELIEVSRIEKTKNFYMKKTVTIVKCGTF